jgi:hypothetical protein
MGGEVSIQTILRLILETRLQATISSFSYNGMADVASAFSSIADRFTDTSQIVSLDSFLEAHERDLGTGPSQRLRGSINEAIWQSEWTKGHVTTIQNYLTKIQKSSAVSIQLSVLSTILSLGLAVLL